MPADPSRPQRIVGEPYVWVTSMGLALGLLMVVGLLAMIVVNGIAVFWPKRVVELTLVEGSASAARGQALVVGEVVSRADRRLISDPTRERHELHIFTGNKDAYGQGFRYVEEGDIAERRQPTDLLVVERMEHGDAIGYPVALHLADGSRLAADAEGFLSALQQRIDQADQRRRRIYQLERKEIGAINREMQGIARRRGRPDGGGDERRALDERMDALQAHYELLAAQARDLRQTQQEDALILRLPTGAERTIVLGSIVDAYQPNELGLSARIGRFLHNLWIFVSTDPREANTEGGIFPAIFGTFVMTLLMSIMVMPFGVVTAIYLREYARQGPLVRAVRIAVNNLAGVPSIVFGVFGLGFFVYGLGGSIDRLFYADALPTPTFGTGGIGWAALTLALMTVPVVIVATEEAIAAVPRGAREGSLACGASKWQTISRIILPASAPGILTGLILAMARGAGEVAPLMLVGVVKLAPTLPINDIWPFVHLDQKFMHLGFHIFDLGFQSPDSEAAKPMVFATTLFLIALVLVLNLSAILIRERLRRRFVGSTF